MSVDWSRHRSESATELEASGTDERLSHQQLSFVYEVARRASIPTWVETHESIRAALCALGEWLDAPRRQAVATHLPAELASALNKGDHPSAGGDDLVALYRCAAQHHDGVSSLHEIALRCAAVLAVLGETLPDAVVAEITEQLPADIAALVPTSPPGTGMPHAARRPWLA